MTWGATPIKHTQGGSARPDWLYEGASSISAVAVELSHLDAHRRTAAQKRIKHFNIVISIAYKFMLVIRRNQQISGLPYCDRAASLLMPT
jgi:hypothetical protein